MPSKKIHCAISRERTNNSFEGLHTWIDAPAKELGVNHRIIRHAYNLEDKKFIESIGGKKAVVEWLFHIAIDNLETAFKEANNAYKGNNVYNFFKFGLSKDSKYIHFDFDKLDEERLKEAFKNKK
jgi:DNA-binding transcriptional regulator YhcF (GntR family)